MDGITMEDILLTLRDKPLDAHTPFPFELMFNRKVKTDLPSIPLTLVNTSASIQAGHRTIKHAEAKSQNRSEPSCLEPDQAVTYVQRPQDKRAKCNSGIVTSVDWYCSHSVISRQLPEAFSPKLNLVFPPVPETQIKKDACQD